MLRPLRRALLSVSDKTGLVELARELSEKYEVQLFATGGTHAALVAANIPVRDVSELTHFPEILDGRVKTLHPAVFAGLLAKRDNREHMLTLARSGLLELDLVVCNVYPFEQVLAKGGITEEQLIENIDIGGPCMIRAAAKNFAAVSVLVDPANYWQLTQELQANNGQTRLEARRRMAGAAFARIAEYDRAIDEYFSPSGGKELASTTLAATFMPMFEKVRPLRHGENSHQQAMFYRELPKPEHTCIANAEFLHGKEVSYNNILDMDSALNLVREFAEPAAAVIKHNNPCGAATAGSLTRAFDLAWNADPVSAFGGILAFNRKLDPQTAAAVMAGERFVECIVAPDYDLDALGALKGWKKNVRILKTGALVGRSPGNDMRRVDGGLLVQARDQGADDLTKWQPVTAKRPTSAEYEALWFTWLVCKHVKSNAIVLGAAPEPGAYSTVGVGAGQMSRVESMTIAIRKAGAKASGSVLASDAFFPFPDNVELAAAAGVVAIVQPGGSVKDAESIAACDKHGIAMLFTGVRHFRH